MQDTLSEVQGIVWKKLGIRKYVAGREMVNDLVEITIANWDHEALSSAKDEVERQIVANGMLLGIKRSHEMLGRYDARQEYGFLWAILLQALVGAIVQILIKWWLESARNRVMIWAVKKELGG
jgi:hypothetical protein